LELVITTDTEDLKMTV